MISITLRRFAPAVPLLAAALCGCGGCGDERETRRIDLGIGPAPERAQAPADAAPTGGETAPVEPAETAAPAPPAAEAALAETAGAEGDPTGAPGNRAASEPAAGTEPTAATSGASAAGVGAPP